MVLLDRRSRKGELCSVSVDHARGGELAAGYLFDLGHKRIAFINGPLQLSQCAERRRGVRRAARRAGLSPEESIIEYTIDPITAFEQAEVLVDKFLAIPDRPTGVVCVNDQIAFTVLRTLAERRVRVPRDMSVVGYGDVDFAAMLSPTLTSIRQPKYELGRAAAGLLIAETVDPLHRHGDIRFEPELIERQSTSARSKLNRYRPTRSVTESFAVMQNVSSSFRSPIVDSHCHAWRRWPYLPLVPDEDERGTIDQLLYEMDTNGVEEALVVCAAIAGNPDNTEYVASARERHPGRFHVRGRPRLRLEHLVPRTGQRGPPARDRRSLRAGRVHPLRRGPQRWLVTGRRSRGAFHRCGGAPPGLEPCRCDRPGKPTCGS